MEREAKEAEAKAIPGKVPYTTIMEKVEVKVEKAAPPTTTMEKGKEARAKGARAQRNPAPLRIVMTITATARGRVVKAKVAKEAVRVANEVEATLIYPVTWGLTPQKHREFHKMQHCITPPMRSWPYFHSPSC